MRWNYTMARQPGNIMAIDWYRKNGLKTMVATAVQSGPAVLFPFDEREINMSSRGIPAIRSFIQLAMEKELEGILCTAWDDRSPHMETYWRGFIASAEYSWSPSKRTLEEYDLVYLQKEYGTTISDYANFYGKLRKATVFWEKAFNKTGNRMDIENALLSLPGFAHWLPPEEPGKVKKTDFANMLIELPDIQRPGTWKTKYAERLDEAKSITKEYLHTSKVLEKLYINSKKNRFHWKLFSALNDFQVTAPHLLLALEQCDTEDKEKLKKGVVKVNIALSEFKKAWENLLSVYGKTRFIAYPDNYVTDRYYHFASQREDLTWIIQVEELFQEKVIKWFGKDSF